ncbi:MAG: hypothetical protein JXA14_26730 [Anaerolineae bacterium]|nr:hypothetical protein [Anaerolineae bacterium]
MHTKQFLTILVLGLGALLALVAGLHTARADPPCTRYVLGIDSSDAGNNCTDEAHPCRTVQHAINQAVNGDVICVAKHTLAGPLVYAERLVITKSITLNGAWDAMCVDPSDLTCSFQPIPCNPANVTLNAQGLGRAISIAGNIAPTIDCFTITGGDADGLGGDPDGPNAGGGIYSAGAAPIIINNVITGNYGCDFCSTTSGRGGGIYLLDAPATAVVSNNLIAGNVGANITLGWGGGVMLRASQAQVLSNTIQDNRGGIAGDGGGIMVVDGSPTIADNTILRNRAATGVAGSGGGISVRSSTPVTIERNFIQLNNALRGTGDPALTSRGGGIYFDGPYAVIRDNEIYGNAATLLDERGLGGGMYLQNLSAAAEVRGNVVANDNRASHVADGNGGGIYLDGCYATVADNQVFNNIASSGTPGYGGGIYVNGGGGLLQGNTITGNKAVLGGVGGWGWGGGMAISGSVALVQDNLIAQNIADWAPNAWGAGGGVYVWGGTPRFVGNDVLSNTTGGGGGGFGGGFELAGASPWLEGNTILGNQAIGAAGGGGGGVRVASCHAFTLTNNIIARNSVSTTGSGVAIGASGAIRGRMAHNTIVANLSGDGVGVYVGTASTVLLYNNIIVSQTVGISNTNPAGSTVSAEHTLFEGNGLNYDVGVVSTNEVPGPAMLLPDYHLAVGSNAIDHAVSLAWVTRDIDGDPRPIGLAPDVGADEWCRRVLLPLVLRNY